MRKIILFCVFSLICFNGFADNCTGNSPNCEAGCYDSENLCSICYDTSVYTNHWSNAGSTSCTACTSPFATAGTNVADHATLHSCKLTCSSGNYYFGSGAGATHNCATCPIGNYCPNNITFYEDDDYNTTFGANPCAQNTYQNQTGQSYCNNCPSSGLTSATETISINLCYKTGLPYAATHGSGTQKCFYGTSSYDQGCTDINITSCVAGYWFQGPAIDCIEVASGWYSADGITTSTQCPGGSDGSDGTRAANTDCYKTYAFPASGTLNAAHITSASGCSMALNSQSTAYTYNVHYNNGQPYQSCQNITVQCASGYTASGNGTANPSCIQCPAGKYINTSGSCINCEDNHKGLSKSAALFLLCSEANFF